MRALLLLGLVISGCEAGNKGAAAASSSTSSPSNVPAATAAPSASSSAQPAAPPPKPIGPKAVTAGTVSSSETWVPAFNLQGFGVAHADLVAAHGACRAKDMALCTEAQWLRACSVEAAIAGVESWTITASGTEGFIIRGGGSCDARKVVQGPAEPPSKSQR